MILWQPIDGRHDVVSPQSVFLGIGAGDGGVIGLLEGHMATASGCLGQTIHRQIVQNRKHPARHVAVGPAVVPPADAALECILDQVVGCRRLARKGSGVTPQGRYQRLDQLDHIRRHDMVSGVQQRAWRIIVSDFTRASPSLTSADNNLFRPQ